MQRLALRAKALLALECPVVMAGDYNICPTDEDVFDPPNWQNDALCRPEARAAFRRVLNLGYVEAFRALHPHAHRAWTFWDYQAGAWQRDLGLRIDHLLLSPEAADQLQQCAIDRNPRGQEKASDHTPIWVDIADKS